MGCCSSKEEEDTSTSPPPPPITIEGVEDLQIPTDESGIYRTFGFHRRRNSSFN
jgi:hypothetical protein